MDPLLYLEDDLRLGEVTRDILSMHWDVTWVVSLAQAKPQLERNMFAVCIFDRMLPDGDATELIAWMRARRDATPVLLLTALGQVSDRVSGLDSGANDYLVKPFDFEELEARLRALTRDYSGKDQGIEIGSWVLYPDHSCLESPYTGRIMLTAKENALMTVLAREPNRVFSREQLLGAVFDHGDSLSTVDTYVHYVRRKADRDLIQTVRGAGYQLGTPA